MFWLRCNDVSDNLKCDPYALFAMALQIPTCPEIYKYKLITIFFSNETQFKCIFTVADPVLDDVTRKTTYQWCR